MTVSTSNTLRGMYSKLIIRVLSSLTLFIFLSLPCAMADDITISGKVTAENGNPLAGVLVDFTIQSHHFAARSRSDGSYSLSISGIYPGAEAGFISWPPFPNPSQGTVRIPVAIPSEGDLSFSVYSLAGRKIFGKKFSELQAGSYRIVWDGSGAYGARPAAGIYIYALTWGNKTLSGRIVLSGNKYPGNGSAYAEPFIIPDDGDGNNLQDQLFKAVANVSLDGYHSLRHTGISFRSDTLIDFTLLPYDNMPYAISGDHIGKKDGYGYLPVVLKGINLGSAPPGYFPGEIAYSIPGETYERWIRMMAETGFNSVRVYTLHPPVFYEKLAEYNASNPDNPLLLFQGVWLEEIANASAPEYDLFNREENFSQSIREVIDCIHGNKSIAFRPGKAYGDYKTDISPWVAAYIIGREVAPQEIDSTNSFNSNIKEYYGYRFSISQAKPSDVFFTRMLDETVHYEQEQYSTGRPVSVSSWPTLDPLNHPTEIYTDEDVASMDISLISEQGDENLLFASYHAYPYYPDFVSEEPAYRGYSDETGPNSYYGYLIDLRSHYADIPLVIAEFGVPSSRGNAHSSFSGMNHGNHSENEQGNLNIRMMQNILNAGCGGGFMFSWMDEWFKRTWIVEYLEAAGFNTGDFYIPTRQLWHNIVSPEQNFGLISYEQEEDFARHDYILDSDPETGISVSAGSNNRSLSITVNTGDPVPVGDSVIIAFDTYRSDLGESVLPGGYVISNRAEFMLKGIRGRDSSTLFVTAAYNMKGLTPRFNFTDPEVQKFRSVISDGAAWERVEWINNGYTGESCAPGIILTGYGSEPALSSAEGMSWDGNKIILRLPWTLLHFYDPTRMAVIDGASSWDGGYHWDIEESESDGVALSLIIDEKKISTASRFTWPGWLVVPPTIEREKASLGIIREGLSLIPDYAW